MFPLAFGFRIGYNRVGLGWGGLAGYVSGMMVLSLLVGILGEWEGAGMDEWIAYIVLFSCTRKDGRKEVGKGGRRVSGKNGSLER